MLYIQLNLNKNKLKANDIYILINQCPLLYKLKIEENQIESINYLFCLNQLKLRKIYIKGNPFCENNKNYRTELFKKIKSLQSIDSLGKNEEIIVSTEYCENENYYEEEEFEEVESIEKDYEENKIEGKEDCEEEEHENEEDEEDEEENEENEEIEENEYDEEKNEIYFPDRNKRKKF